MAEDTRHGIAAVQSTAAPGAASHPNRRFPIVGIGASAGGLEAYRALLAHLPVDTGMAFVLVQHLDPVHESELTKLLARATAMPVTEVTDNLRAEPDHVYVIPPNANLSIADSVLKLQPRSQSRMPARSIDAFFESLAQDQRACAVGVVLSGTASDGTLGLEAIKAEGGITFAQDYSAKYDSMPRSAAAAGCVDFVLSPEGIALELARIAKHPYVSGRATDTRADAEVDRADATLHEDDAASLPSGGDGTPDTRARRAKIETEALADDVGRNGFNKVLLLLHNHCGVDFSLYKSTTIQRRIARRMVLNKQETPTQYANSLRDNVKELDALYSDVLISVTSFFRNPEAFEVLTHRVFPELLRQPGDDPIRVWVLGCSTGQEAYSIAMAFVDAAEAEHRLRKLQVFATDLNEALLDKARHGLYARSLVEDVTPERLRRFFVEEEGGYRINKALREMVVFARQNLISDPPFSRIDFISCRNLLIYLEPHLQKRVIPAFHYALKPHGYLFLGVSESIGGFTDLFEPSDKKHKIYSKKVVPQATFHLPGGTSRGPHTAQGERGRPFPVAMERRGAAEGVEGLRSEFNAEREADRVTVNQFAPPAVLINAELQILQFRGPTSPYLEPPSGKASFDVLKMARDGLMLPLRSAINQAKKDNTTARRENVSINQHGGGTRTVHVQVIPLKNLPERSFLVVFEDVVAVTQQSAGATRPRGGSKGKSASRSLALTRELAETREYLQAVQEQYETANEKLQASNEEVQSANEELQSINEELETSKEELESTNEELTTVNEEMASRNTELHRLNSDLVNVQTSANLAIVLLGRDLSIRRFTSQAGTQFHLLATDVGRPFSSVRHDLTLADLEALVADVITSVRAFEAEVQDRTGHWFSLRVRPYLTHDNKVDGAVLVLVDIDASKRNQLAAASARDYAEAILRTARDPLLTLDADLRVRSANHAFYRTFATTPAETEGRMIYELGNGQWNIPHLRQLLEDVLPRNSFFNDLEITHDFETVGRCTMLLNARQLGAVGDEPARILLGIQDITESLEAQAATRQSGARYQALVEASAQIVWTTDANGRAVEDSRSWRAFSGQTYGEFQGLGWLDALHPDDRERVRTQWLRAVAERMPIEIEYRLHHVSGDWRWTSVRAVPVLNPDGSVREWVGMNSDITGRKHGEEALRSSEDRLAKEVEAMQLLQSASALLIEGGKADALYQKIVDAARGIMRSDGASLQIVDEDRDGLRLLAWTGFDPTFGQIFEFTPPDAETSCSVARRTGRRVIVSDVERCDFIVSATALESFRKTGIRAVQSTPLFSRDGTLLGVCSTHWRTQHTPTENDLALFDILARQAADLLERKQAVEGLREADRHKNTFLAMLAHELRNPLAPIRNALEILRRTPGDGQAVHAATAMMDRQIGEMVRLVDDLLDVSRISRGKIEILKGPIELASAINHAVEAARPACEKMGHELTVTLPPQPLYLNADPVRLTQVVGNLLNNACKFTDKGGRISLTVERNGTHAVLRVRDTGIGIPADQLSCIFDMFTQVEQSLVERAHTGLGIGLALVKRIVEMHDGTVEARSEGVGNGSEFVVRLPLLAETRHRQSPREMSGDDQAAVRRRILVVDDNRDSAESLTTLLQLAGHDVQTAYDGLQALEAAAEIQPDIILLDIGLPNLNGYDVARRIRERPWGNGVVLVALTGWGQDEDRRRSADAGFNHHLVKPVDLVELKNLIAEPGTRGEAPPR